MEIAHLEKALTIYERGVALQDYRATSLSMGVEAPSTAVPSSKSRKELIRPETKC